MLAALRVPIALDRLYESDDPGLVTFAHAVVDQAVAIQLEANKR